MKEKAEKVERSERKTREGLVLSAKMQKTVVVGVDRTFRHPQYEKVVRQKTRLYARDTLGAKEGDRVLVMETRPLSRLVRWRVVEILERSK
ncbi:MAG: 30S ribosomal protein S17 [candidate division Zixibacteria bacterium]|nr:30S ribosomal protein S17 [candidate division Zixibacteria bacterium]MCI0596943.1 30S ribosomal protein S17 [candidate division Zixibacteria bacterium]